MSRANPNLILIAALVLVLVTVAGYLVAARDGIDFAPILAIVGPVIAAMFIQPSMSRIERKTDQAVAQTNGALTGPLADLSREVAELRGLLTPAQASLYPGGVRPTSPNSGNG